MERFSKIYTKFFRSTEKLKNKFQKIAELNSKQKKVKQNKKNNENKEK